jgi:hypothetical protein
VRAALVAKGEVVGLAAMDRGHGAIGMQIHLFLLDALPEALNEQRMEFLRMTSMMSGDGSFAGTRDVRFRDGQDQNTK